MSSITQSCMQQMQQISELFSCCHTILYQICISADGVEVAIANPNTSTAVLAGIALVTLPGNSTRSYSVLWKLKLALLNKDCINNELDCAVT